MIYSVALGFHVEKVWLYYLVVLFDISVCVCRLLNCVQFRLVWSCQLVVKSVQRLSNGHLLFARFKHCMFLAVTDTGDRSRTEEDCRRVVKSIFSCKC